MTEIPTPPPTPVKVCPHCAAQAQTTGEFCPYCGKPYARQHRSRPSAKLVALVAGVVVLVVIGTGVAVASSHQSSQHQAKEAAAAQASASASASAAAARTAKAAADLKAAEDAAERKTRAESVKGIESSVKKDATKDYKDGLLNGPIKSVSCTPTNGGSTDDLDAKSTTYQCFAAYKVNKDGTERGYYFDATMNWATGSYTWNLADN